MRTFGLLGALAIIIALAGSAAAQSPIEGPLAAPDAVPVPKTRTKPLKKAHAKPKTAHRDVAQPSEAYGSSSPGAQPVVHTSRDAPADPLSLGMKWNGSNDTARETRVQNYDGGAAGTGAEVGMKLHF